MFTRVPISLPVILCLPVPTLNSQTQFQASLYKVKLRPLNRGEWEIPLAALGLKPEPGLKVGFNMAAFYSEFGEWHCWEGTQAENWRLEQAGTLQFK